MLDGNKSSLPRTRGVLTDRDMVVAFKGGDARAYASIYREYRPVAEAICQRILGNHEDAAEAAQETMLRVFQGLPRFNGRYLLRAWVARIATNVCLDTLRKRSRRPDEVESPAAEDLERSESVLGRLAVEDPGLLLERAEDSRQVSQLLGSLPAHHREALLMREFEGLSHEQIGDALGMTAPQVKALLHRAKKSFKRAWDVQSGRASGIALPFLPAFLRFLRRAVSPAKHVAEAAHTAAAEAVIQISAQPALATAGSQVTERVAAAAGALLVAGTIGIGAVALPHHSRPSIRAARPPAEALSVVDPPSSSPTVVVVAAKPAPVAAPAHAKRQGHEVGPAASDAPAEPAPVEQPAQPGQGASDPTPAPEPSPSATPSPTATPAPPYSMAFTMSQESGRNCGCDPTPRLVENQGTTGSPGQSMVFKQGAVGAVYDPNGNPALDLRVDYGGNVDGSEGSLTVNFRVTIGQDVYTYRGDLTLMSHSKIAGQDGWAYRFTGKYVTVGASDGPNPLAPNGSMDVTLSFWGDGTIYKAKIHTS